MCINAIKSKPKYKLDEQHIQAGVVHQVVNVSETKCYRFVSGVS